MDISNELYHYGVKGMKWGVRHDRPTIGRIIKPKKYYSAAHKKSDKKYKIAMGVFAASAGIAAATIIGTKAYQRGMFNADAILKAGTLVQNVAPEGRSFAESFYGTRDEESARFFKSEFTQLPNSWFGEGTNRNTITNLSSDEDIRIAGRKNMDKALKDIVRSEGKNPRKYHAEIVQPFASSNGPELKIVKGRSSKKRADELWRSYGKLDPTGSGRQKIEDTLHSKGYGGFKDYNDMLIGWGNTPTVFFGKKSGLKIINQETLSEQAIKDLKAKGTPKTKNGRIVMAKALAGTAASMSISGLTDTSNFRTRNDNSFKFYGKPYKKLNKKQKADLEKKVAKANNEEFEKWLAKQKDNKRSKR